MIEYTHPSVLAGIAAGASWADPTMDPTLIDWADRQARAAIPFPTADGRPVNPCQSTGIRHGRGELGHWGEQLCADALVTATTTAGHRWLLMVERADGHGWALPGGYVDPGETPTAAAKRELAEETGLALPDDARWRAAPARYVPDPRATDEAWMVTVPVVCAITTDDLLPAVVAADDARRVSWVLATSYDVLTGCLAECYSGTVFAAHRDLLTDWLV